MDMKISELRPNNLYHIKRNILVVLEDHLNDGTSYLLYFHGMPSGVPLAQVRPIPLTGEWLRQLGLVERYVKGEWSWANCTPGREWQSDTELHNDGGKYYYIAGYPPIEYVHQLQNLYAAITRQELTYKPDLLTPSKDIARIQRLESGLETIAEMCLKAARDMENVQGVVAQKTYHTLRALSTEATKLLKESV
jgi:hypothetical protein